MTNDKQEPADKIVGSTDELEREIAELNAAVDAFSIAMKAKLAAKAKAGWAGWRSHAYDGMIVSRLIAKANLVEFDRKQAVDIANFAMMLWRQSDRPNTL